MKKWFLYLLLFSGILFVAGAYIYRQNQYEKFETFFLEAKLYGTEKIVLDSSFIKHYKQLHIDSRVYKYLIFLKIDDQNALGNIYVRTIFDKNFKITGGGTGGSIIGNHPLYGIKNSIYLKFITEKWIPNKKSAFYLIVEYEKGRQIRYYFEITEKVENKKYTIYFKSYLPKRILNAKNQYIKD